MCVQVCRMKEKTGQPKQKWCYCCLNGNVSNQWATTNTGNWNTYKKKNSSNNYRQRSKSCSTAMMPQRAHAQTKKFLVLCRLRCVAYVVGESVSIKKYRLNSFHKKFDYTEVLGTPLYIKPLGKLFNGIALYTQTYWLEIEEQIGWVKLWPLQTYAHTHRQMAIETLLSFFFSIEASKLAIHPLFAIFFVLSSFLFIAERIANARI